MLALRRILTALVLFVAFTFALVFASAVIGGGVHRTRNARGRVAPQIEPLPTIAPLPYPGQPPIASQVHEGERSFWRRYGGLMSVASVGISLVISLRLSFSGIFPWCRNPHDPPSLPPPA